MELKRDWASKAWLQPSDEPRDVPVRMMNQFMFFIAAPGIALGVYAIVAVILSIG